MSRGTFRLVGPYDAWHAAAGEGFFTAAGESEIPAIALLGAEGTSASGVERALAEAAEAIALRNEGVLPLIGVCTADSRLAWVYPAVEALGLSHLVGTASGTTLSTRAAAEIVATVARTLLDLGPTGLAHKGPEPSDLLLDRQGRLYVAGFAGPFAPSPSRRPAQEGGREASLVYRLGVLLAELASGMTPESSPDEDSQGAMIRTVLRRAMGRPGPAVTERFSDWLRGMLAWDPALRPPLSTVPDGLAKVGADLGGPSLCEWAAANVEALRMDAGAKADAQRRGGDTAAKRPAPRPIDGTAEVGEGAEAPTLTNAAMRLRRRISEFEEDDPTQETSGARPRPAIPPPRTGVTRPRQSAAIPVQVGPPAEVVAKMPSLPPNFLDGNPTDERERPVSGLPEWWTGRRYLWIAAILLVFLALLLVAVNVALWTWGFPFGGRPAPSPSLDQLIGPEEVAPDAPGGEATR